ncbi:MAG TPA: hypothetical protein VH092_12145 [Urbifossiella sp.]|nr:hypothetical protein [Urbifossiella sp.]
MTSRLCLTAATLATGLFAAPVVAAENTIPRPGYGFSTLRPMAADAARAKAEAYLKATGRYDASRVDAVWAKTDLTLLDKVADTLALGSTDAEALVRDARRTDVAAAAAAPAFLKDAKLDPFARANLALVFARANANRRAYEESLDALAGVTPELVVDPAGYFFFKAVSEHATMKRDAALASIVRLRDDVTDSPDRYNRVGLMMIADMLSWNPDPKDFTNISRLMDNSGRRLDLSRPGEKTQDIQKRIVFRLDELIKEAESKCKGGQCNGGNCPNGGKPGDKLGNGGTLAPNAPAPDSTIMGGAGAGKVDDRKLREVAEVWGTLPPDRREAVIQELTRDLPARYKPMIDEYFRSLNRLHGYSNRP